MSYFIVVLISKIIKNPGPSKIYPPLEDLSAFGGSRDSGKDLVLDIRIKTY